ncbi:MAG: double-strand break repair helicase AddA [Mesorhizobium sp.]
MKRRLVIPPETVALQARASDPEVSAWVSANAGSGKTHVLAQRVIRLLLGGTDPSKILCLTYTRAAAANMANRVFASLAGWAMLPDDGLASALAEIEGRRPDDRQLKRARRLFARALETPGGLKIQTIHAFCEAVLHQFPLEANIAGHFEILDSAMETSLIAEARRDMISGAAGRHDAALAEAFAAVLERGGEYGLDVLLSEVVAKRDRLREFLDQCGVGLPPFAELFEAFGFTDTDSEATIVGAAWPDAYFNEPFCHALVARAVRAGKANAEIFGRALLAACQAHTPGTRLARLCDAFLTKEQQPRSVRQIASKGVADHFPDFAERFTPMAERVREAADRLALFRMLEGTRAALTLADWLIRRYEQLKSGRGFLDFNDLIARTVRLLARQDAGPWVQYKLDQGIDHILIDEAQDTSPEQWQVVKDLAAEFFAGHGARDTVKRTLFAVGDEKQSIYSFQGADPESFALTGDDLASRVKGSGGAFERLRLTWSFRSTEDVLSAVDRVFSHPDMQKGLGHDRDPLSHRPLRAGAPGYVEVWPSIGADAVTEPDDWTKSVDHARAPAVRVAENVAATIAGWLSRGEALEGTGATVTAGDILVLVRKRDRFVHALSRSLKAKGVAVAGADRLSLPAHIAVKDLVALGRFLLQPEDDLSLAAVLKSPIFGESEERLYELAAGRGPGVSLQAALTAKAAKDLWFARIASQLDSWASEAAYKPAFEFFAGVLGRDGVRRAMVERLGQDAGDVLDEFLSYCLAQERVGLPGLESLLSTLDTAAPEIRREMDQTRDEVRIMTVHAAKGLEAPIVFLVDGGSAPFSEQHLPRLVPFDAPDGLWQGSGYLWRSGGDVANSTSQQAGRVQRMLAEEEYRRLLYVGMTRAEDRLIVCGYFGKRTPPDTTWHAIVSRALTGEGLSETRQHPADSEATVHRYRVSPAPEPPDGTNAKPAATAAAETLPAWLAERQSEPPPLPAPLSPSRAMALIEDAPAAPGKSSPVLDAADASFAIRRGLAAHRLLQMLPDVEPRNRGAAARRYLERAGADWPPAEREAALVAVAAVLGDEEFAPIFSPGSRAEVAVMGTLDMRGRPRVVSGTIDRLAMTGDRVLIVDYKTNRPPPETLDDVAPAYLLQMALYRALLAPLYPGRKVEAALLFTEAPRLIALPDAVLDSALARLTKP